MKLLLLSYIVGLLQLGFSMTCLADGDVYYNVPTQFPNVQMTPFIPMQPPAMQAAPPMIPVQFAAPAPMAPPSFAPMVPMAPMAPPSFGGYGYR